ncbi:MAG: sigma-70 family RNA polymerase sigma factor [Nocardioidaceae bacterium]
MGQPDVTDNTTIPSDAELITAVRDGDATAYGTLFERHRDAAVRLGRQLVGPGDADDLVSDAFVKVLRVLQRGGGPDVAFRAYLLTAVRRLHIDKIRVAKKIAPTDEVEQFDRGVPFADPVVAKFEHAAAAKAFASLPERWQLVLWHLEVEGQKPAQIAPLLGVSANTVSALGYRAREGLRQSYLQVHVADAAADDCRWVIERLGAHVRKGLSARDERAVEDHLDGCRSCAAICLELTEVNSDLAGFIAPILLGTAAAGYLASTGSTAGGAGAVFARVAALAKAHAGIAAGGVAGVVALAVTTVIITHQPQPPADNASNPAVQARIVNPANSTTTPRSRPGAPPPGGQNTTGGRGLEPPLPGAFLLPPFATGSVTSTSQTTAGSSHVRSTHSNTGRLPVSTQNPTGPPVTGPTGTAPTGTGPTGTDPTTTGPPSTAPTTTRPTSTGPTTSPPSTRPTTTHPTTTRPTTTHPTTTHPTTTSPTTTRPPGRTTIDLSLTGSPLLPSTRLTLHIAANPRRPTSGALAVRILVSVPGQLSVSGSGWSCPITGPQEITCTSSPTATPHPIVASWSLLLPGLKAVALVSASDNSDPHLLNNVIHWLL